MLVAATAVKKPRSGSMVTQFGENGGRVLEQANEHQHAEQRKCDQVDREQCRSDFTAAEPHGCDGNDAGRHDEREASAGKIEYQRRECGSARSAVQTSAVVLVISGKPLAFNRRNTLGRYRLQLFEVVPFALGFFGFLASAP